MVRFEATHPMAQRQSEVFTQTFHSLYLKAGSFGRGQRKVERRRLAAGEGVGIRKVYAAPAAALPFIASPN